MEKTPSRPLKDWWIAAALLIAVFAVFGRSLPYHFVYDDQWTILKNYALESVRPLSRFLLEKNTTAVPSSGLQNLIYRPLATLSFALDRKLWGFDPRPWRFENLLLHGLNGILVFLFLLTQMRFSRPAAAFGSLLFLLHPVQVETVAWINQRSNLFCFLGMITALRYLAGSASTGRTAGGFAAFAGALLSKETAAVLPGLLALEDARSAQTGREKERLLKKTGVYAAAVFAVAAYVALRRSVIGQWSQRAPRSGSRLGDLLYGAASWLDYWRLILFPVHLTVSHTQTGDDPWRSPASWAGAVFLAASLAAAVWLWRRRAKIEAAGLIWVFIALLPVLGIFPIDALLCERFLYVPLFGVAVLWACLWEALDSRKERRKAALAFFCAATAVWALLSFQRTAAWQDDITLWRAAVQTEPANAFAHACLGDAYIVANKPMPAVEEYSAVLQNRPTIPVAFAALNNLAHIYNALRRPDLSLPLSAKALEIHPDALPALYNRAESFALLGKRREALALLERLQALYPAVADWGAVRKEIFSRR